MHAELEAVLHSEGGPRMEEEELPELHWLDVFLTETLQLSAERLVPIFHGKLVALRWFGFWYVEPGTHTAY